METALRQDRLRVIDAGTPSATNELSRDVRAGLTAPEKRLSCRYFYDPEGSRLFEEICALEEYYLTRAEREILEARAPALAGMLAPGTTVVELGSGSAVKTRVLIEAILERHASLRYVPIDVSRSMLVESCEELIDAHPRLQVLAIAAEYDRGFEELAKLALGPKLFLWLGSNIGNFDRTGAAAFLRRIREVMGAGDRLLVGIDLRKEPRVLRRAYDDARGVTAAFNKNILRRINRELDADFELDAFEHRADYDEVEGRIEMYLVSRRPQVVHVRALELEVRLAAGERIHTEDSYKYSAEEIRALAGAAGLRLDHIWLDAGGRFAEVVLSHVQ